MAERTLMTRVREWFRGSDVAGDDSGAVHEAHLTDEPARLSSGDTSSLSTLAPEAEPRNSLFRPFAKRDAAMQSLQQGFVTLTDLMVGIREGLDRQSERQDNLLEHLSRLPAILEQLPENSRMHGETLKALQQEMAGQHDSQRRLTEILDHVSKSNGQTRDAMEGLQDRVEKMRQTDDQIANNLVNVGSTMQELGRSTTTGAQILESLRDNMSVRDNEMRDVLHRQGTRFTVMLLVAIFLSIAALVAVAVMGWLILNRPA